MCFGGEQKTGGANNFNITNQTSSTSYDPWVTQGGQGIYNAASGWLSKNPWSNYSGPLAASFGPEFGQAASYLSSQLGKTNPFTTQGAGALQGVIGAINPNASISDYMNPYVDATLSPTIRNINEAAGQAGQRNAADAAMSGAYGGTASGVRQALLDRDTQRSISDATSQAYSGAFNNAQNARLQNLSMLSGAGNSLAGIGQNAFSQGTTLAQLLAGMGSTQQQAGQQGIQNAISLNKENQIMPMTQFGMLASILRGLPLNSTTNTFGIGSGQQNQYQPNNSGYGLLGALLGGLF